MSDELGDLEVFSVTYSTCLLVAIYIGLIEWNRRKFMKYKNEEVMQNRWASITLTESKLALFHFIFVFIYEIFDGLYWSSLNDKSESSPYFAVKRIMYLFHLIFLQCAYCIGFYDSEFIVSSIIQNLYYLDQFSTIMISTWWVLKRVRPIISISLDRTNRYSSTDNNSLPLKSYDMNKYRNIQHQLIQTLNNGDQFDQFMDHYAMDLNIKKLLAFIELIQFQQFVPDDNIDMNGNRNGPLFQRLNFDSFIPRSFIVFSPMNNNGNGTLFELKLKSYLLFEKYVNYGAKYEIDIDDNIRRRLCDIMDNKLEWLDHYDINQHQLRNLFTPVCNDIFQSMIGSYYRFRENQ